MKPRLITKGALGIAAVALAATACGSSGGGPASSGGGAPSGGSGAADVTNTAAAQLRGGLDGLLRAHVDLTANVVQLVTATGSLSNPEVQGAIAALNQNTNDLGKAIGSLYGSAAQKQFLKLWRAHIGFFVTYVQGDLTHNNALKQKAQHELDGYRQQFGAFIASATNNALTKQQVAAELAGHVQTLEAAIDAITSNSPDAAAKVQMAAEHMDGTAAALAGAIGKAKGLAGNADGAGSSLRAGLTGLLTQHVAQTVYAVESVVQTGSLTSPQAKGAIAALNQNTNDLGKAIGSLYGSAAQKQFLKLWRAHIGFFVTYVQGDLTHNNALKQKAQHQLDGYRQQFGAFIASATNNALTKQQVAAELAGHVQTLEAAIDAITSKASDEGNAVYMAEQHMWGTGAALAQAIAKANPSKFTT